MSILTTNEITEVFRIINFFCGEFYSYPIFADKKKSRPRYKPGTGKSTKMKYKI
jgi:hypothetical protein